MPVEHPLWPGWPALSGPLWMTKGLQAPRDVLHSADTPLQVTAVMWLIVSLLKGKGTIGF